MTNTEFRTVPRRVQRKRSRGWRMPPNTVSVSRPGKWGNPFKVLNGNHQDAVDKFESLFTKPPSRLRHTILSICSGRPGIGEGAVLDMKLSLHELRGKNLACWCDLCDKHKDGLPLGVNCPDCGPCHGDVLLRIANTEPHGH